MGLDETVLQHLMRETGGLVLRSGSTASYVGIGRAQDAVGWLEAQGFAISGMEGFLSDGRSVRPLEACIADLSGLDPSSSARAARQILEEWSETADWIDFTLAGA
ncbi:MAG: hypothetical protein AAGA99_02355 [Actinomycetota bacterium]